MVTVQVELLADGQRVPGVVNPRSCHSVSRTVAQSYRGKSGAHRLKNLSSDTTSRERVERRRKRIAKQVSETVEPQEPLRP